MNQILSLTCIPISPNEQTCFNFKMPQIDTLIIMPILIGLCPILFLHYFIIILVSAPNFFGVIKFRNKLITFKKHITISLNK